MHSKFTKHTQESKYNLCLAEGILKNQAGLDGL